MAKGTSRPPQGRLHRLRKLAGVGARVGVDVVGKAVKRWRGGEEDAPISLGTAEKLAATLGDLKGAAMKLGQFAAMDAELLPAEVRAVLARLQNEAPPMPWEDVADVIEDELGAPPESLFAELEREPMAAASLGQVHRGKMADGREVVVKVQYPGIGAALEADLDNMGSVAKAVNAAFGKMAGYFSEIRRELLAELDYAREARLCGEFREAARSLPDLCVPFTVPERTRTRVLTLERLPGETLKAFLGRGVEKAAPEERFRVSRLLLRAVLGPFLAGGVVHADPHPGNYVLMPDGRLGVVDYGSIKRLPDPFTGACRKLLRLGLSGEPFDVVPVARELGIEWGDLPEDQARELMNEVLEIGSRPIRGGVFDYATSTMVGDLRALKSTRFRQLLKFRPPAEGLLFFRAVAGCVMNLRAIGARGEFRAVFEELEALAPR
ncbi:MAG TPA: AarF/ABC1/UbiB kinase family protein [Myxococcaceae bacterium]|nr:AarF/ABC1/UbiB kinase family protein [Myxococcaceae bacterium]